MSERDTGRSAFYAAEKLIHNLFERAGATRSATLAGTTLTLPSEAKFGDVDSVARYVQAVLAMASVRDEFARATLPVSVRARRGQRSAEYRVRLDDPPAAEIAIPLVDTWALRELVVLHEVAHHLDDSAGANHGPGFIDTLITLVGLVLGPEAAFVYRVILSDALRSG